MPTHKEGSETGLPERLPGDGDIIEVRRSVGEPWSPRAHRSTMVALAGGGYCAADTGWFGPGYGTGEGTGWRWPEGGAVAVPVQSGPVRVQFMEPITGPEVPPEQRKGRLCKCGLCGLVAVCEPACDFYDRVGESFLRCSACVLTDAPPSAAPVPAERRGAGPDGGPDDRVKPPRRGFVLVACDGSAHSNPYIDNCTLCAPRWGWREMRRNAVPEGETYWFRDAGRGPGWIEGGWLPGAKSEPAPHPAPEVRRCEVPIPGTEPGPGAAPDVCGAVLGRELTPERCRVCLGTRCFSHCGGAGHYVDTRLVAGGGSQGWEWQLFARGPYFAGQTWRTGGGERGEMLTFGGLGHTDSERVMGETLAAFSARSMPEAELCAPPPEQLLLRELPQDAVRFTPPPVAGHVLGALASLAGTAAVAADDLGYAARRRSVAVIDAARTWLEQSDGAWDDLAEAEDMSPRMVERCRQLRNRELVNLFARIAGAL